MGMDARITWLQALRESGLSTPQLQYKPRHLHPALPGLSTGSINASKSSQPHHNDGATECISDSPYASSSDAEDHPGEPVLELITVMIRTREDCLQCTAPYEAEVYPTVRELLGARRGKLRIIFGEAVDDDGTSFEDLGCQDGATFEVKVDLAGHLEMVASQLLRKAGNAAGALGLLLDLKLESEELWGIAEELGGMVGDRCVAQQVMQVFERQREQNEREWAEKLAGKMKGMRSEMLEKRRGDLQRARAEVAAKVKPANTARLAVRRHFSSHLHIEVPARGHRESA